MLTAMFTHFNFYLLLFVPSKCIGLLKTDYNRFIIVFLLLLV